MEGGYIMKKTCTIFFVIMLNCFLLGCEPDKGYSITIKNDTERDITLFSFSGQVKNEMPIVIESHTETKLFSDVVASGIDIVFLYNEKKYCINTGYADDYRQFTLQFSESETSPYGIVCFFVVKSVFGREEDPREIEEMRADG